MSSQFVRHKNNTESMIKKYKAKVKSRPTFKMRIPKLYSRSQSINQHLLTVLRTRFFNDISSTRFLTIQKINRDYQKKHCDRTTYLNVIKKLLTKFQQQPFYLPDCPKNLGKQNKWLYPRQLTKPIATISLGTLVKF